MIVIKSPREIELMKKAGRVVALVFEALEGNIKPGMSTQDVADICVKAGAEDNLEKHAKELAKIHDEVKNTALKFPVPGI